MEKKLLITGGRLLDPSEGIDMDADLLIENGVVSGVLPVGANKTDQPGCTVLDATGLIVSPGFIDLHSHLREPGFEDKETIASGSQAAVRGGFTTVCAMPNTNPPIDNASVVQFYFRKSREAGLVRVLPIACATKGRQGNELVEMAELAEEGVIGFSDDGDPVADPFVMRTALTYSAQLDLPVIQHCEDPGLALGGVLNEGWVASRLGLLGIPAKAEENMASRDIELAALTGGSLHLAHISTAGTLELTRRAKERGLRVTAEVTPHHLLLTEDWVLGMQGNGDDWEKSAYRFAPLGVTAFDSRAKVNPPLRTRSDAVSLIQGLREGLIDAIATDHAPHSHIDKSCSFEDAAFGISGFETAFGLLMLLVHRGDLDLKTLVERLTTGPARILPKCWNGLGSLRKGARGDVTIFDPYKEWRVVSDLLVSKGKNTPIDGMRLRGKIVATVVGGEVVYMAQEVKEH